VRSLALLNQPEASSVTVKSVIDPTTR